MCISDSPSFEILSRALLLCSTMYSTVTWDSKGGIDIPEYSRSKVQKSVELEVYMKIKRQSVKILNIYRHVLAILQDNPTRLSMTSCGPF